MVINEFKDDFAFLSNFYPCKIWFDGMDFPSIEHAYSSAKTMDMDERWLIQSASTPGKAKKLGRNIVLRSDWESVKIPIMYGLIQQKFAFGSELADKLLNTGSTELIEGNWWGDTFWGVCKGKGENHLGKLLMKWRNSLQRIKQLENI